MSCECPLQKWLAELTEKEEELINQYEKKNENPD